MKDNKIDKLTAKQEKYLRSLLVMMGVEWKEIWSKTLSKNDATMLIQEALNAHKQMGVDESERSNNKTD